MLTIWKEEFIALNKKLLAGLGELDVHVFTMSLWSMLTFIHIYVFSDWSFVPLLVIAMFLNLLSTIGKLRTLKQPITKAVGRDFAMAACEYMTVLILTHIYVHFDGDKSHILFEWFHTGIYATLISLESYQCRENWKIIRPGANVDKIFREMDAIAGAKKPEPPKADEPKQ